MKTRNYKSIATLWETWLPITCSMDVAIRIKKSLEVIGFNTFEEAAKSVISWSNKALLVPNAYVNISGFFMSEELLVREVFIEKIPALVLAWKQKNIPKNIKNLFLHPSTKSLIEISEKLSMDNHDNTKKKMIENIVLVNSNQEACEKVLNDTDFSIAITNSICAKYFELEVYEILRPEKDMSFSIFEKAV